MRLLEDSPGALPAEAVAAVRAVAFVALSVRRLQSI
jgi:hypothetical protein